MASATRPAGFRYLNADQVPLETFSPDSPVVTLHRYWRSIVPAPGRLPGRWHLEPADIDDLVIPWIWVVDVIDEAGMPLDYLYRMVGAGNVTLVGRDATGELASTIFGRVDAPFVMGTFDLTVHTAAPTFWVATVPHDGLGEVTIHRGLFPLADDGRTVDTLLCIAAPWPPH